MASQRCSPKRQAWDLLSELPDPLLCSIISYLPTKEAIATSILSRRWRSLWKCLTRIDIGFCPRSLPGESYSEEIEKVLFSQENSFISVFQLVLSRGNLTLEELGRWIEYLKEEKNVEQISLIGKRLVRTLGLEFTPTTTWPANFFRGRTLRLVELKYLAIGDASAFEDCINLVSVSVADGVLAKIISNCIFLENLTLIGARYLKKLDIRDTRLKYLGVGNLCLTKFELRAESLRYLSLNNVACSAFIFECSNLDEFQLYSTTGNQISRVSCVSKASHFLERLSGIRVRTHLFVSLTMNSILHAWPN
ncbi:F-box/LRR-repeat protein 25-like [Coffea arabica]|uniref:F-box/LRR-repeat protein 25-like n=1 Tax=Coffea arabica TaxID=13443 RepID=A0A6P6S501_COFAR